MPENYEKDGKKKSERARERTKTRKRWNEGTKSSG